MSVVVCYKPTYFLDNLVHEVHGLSRKSKEVYTNFLNYAESELSFSVIFLSTLEYPGVSFPMT